MILLDVGAGELALRAESGAVEQIGKDYGPALASKAGSVVYPVPVKAAGLRVDPDDWLEPPADLIVQRIMERMAPPGANPQIDRFVQGFEGTAILRNPQGVQVLSSVKRIVN